MTLLDKYLGRYYDKIQHCLGSMLLVLIGYFFSHRKWLGWILLSIFLIGFLKEILIDHFLDWYDILANSTGIALAAGLIWWRG